MTDSPWTGLSDDLAELHRLREEVQVRRDAMHAIFWLNTHPTINEVCEAVYSRYEDAPPYDIEVRFERATVQACSRCGQPVPLEADEAFTFPPGLCPQCVEDEEAATDDGPGPVGT
jgi:uncharacterized metal-binding protein YceD (DUF177 family)